MVRLQFEAPPRVIRFVVFSRARPLQLHGYLASLLKVGYSEASVAVLVKIDPEYLDAYQDVQLEFPRTYWCYEKDFASDLQAILAETEQPCVAFGCDDVVFTRPISPLDISRFLDEQPQVLGVSLRLGRHIERNMFGALMPQPSFMEWGIAAAWDVTDAASVVDWGYPWEVLGTVYRTEFVKRVVEAAKPANPSRLEQYGADHWREFSDQHFMVAPTLSCLVVPTVNLVQDIFPNGIAGRVPLSPELLLQCWNAGLRLDVQRYEGMTPLSWRIPDFYLRRDV
jgi:hypothetical protein